MAVTSISVILTVFVLKLHHCGPHQAEVPRWMRYLVLKVLARIVRCQCSGLEDKKNKNRRNRKKKNNKLPPNENAEVCLRLVNEVNMNKHSPVAEFRSNTANRNGRQDTSPTGMNTTSLTFDPSVDLKRLTVMEEILKYLKIMVAKRDEDDSENEVINEWRQVAAVMDRFFFWFFLLTTMAATLVMMVFIPLFRER